MKLLRLNEWTCHIHVRTIWVILGLYTILWGFWFAAPWWTVFDQAPLYDEMSDFMPEIAWGFNAMLAGSIMLYGSSRESVRGLAWGMGAGVYHWGTIAVLYFMGDWQNTGGITSLMLAVLVVVTWRVALYCARLHRFVEDHHVYDREIVIDD